MNKQTPQNTCVLRSRNTLQHPSKSASIRRSTGRKNPANHTHQNKPPPNPAKARSSQRTPPAYPFQSDSHVKEQKNKPDRPGTQPPHRGQISRPVLNPPQRQAEKAKPSHRVPQDQSHQPSAVSGHVGPSRPPVNTLPIPLARRNPHHGNPNRCGPRAGILYA
jgi:hypothetical protein